MSRRKRIILSWVITLVVLLSALQVIVDRHALAIFRRAVIPKAEQTLGTGVSVETAGANILTRSLKLGGVRIAHPGKADESALVSAERSSVGLSILSLLRGVIGISRARVEQAVITIEHTASKAGSTGEVQQAAAPRAPSPPRPEGGMSAGPPRVLVKELFLDTVLRYTDRDVATAEPFRLAMTVSLNAKNLANFPRRDQGSFRLTGHQADHPDAFRTDLRGTVGSLADPQRLDFDLEGRMEAIDLKMIQPLFRKTGVDGDAAVLDLRLICRNGVYREGESWAAVRFKNPRLTGKVPKLLRGMPLPSDFTLNIPVGGTFRDPVFDAETGLIRSVLAIFAGPAASGAPQGPAAREDIRRTSK